jgi:hypothetical protein
LQRISETESERERPDIFGPLNDLPRRKKRLNLEWPKVAEGYLLQGDARSLHDAYVAGDRLKYNIGLSVPDSETSPSRYSQGRKLDPNFQFLLQNGNRSWEILAKPVGFREEQRKWLKPSLSSTLPSFTGNSYVENLLPPLAPINNGYRLNSVPAGWLAELAPVETLEKLLKRSRDSLNPVRLPLQDRTAIAISIVEGCFRLLGSEWLENLDVANIQGKKSRDGSWMTMLSGEQGDRSIARTLEALKDEGRRARGNRNLSVHCQIFRLGLIVTELILRVPISYIDKDPTTSGARIWIKDLSDEPFDALELASRVDAETNNRLLGNILQFCLMSMQDKAVIRDDAVADKFYRKALIP